MGPPDRRGNGQDAKMTPNHRSQGTARKLAAPAAGRWPLEDEMKDFSKLDETKHMLMWLADDPYAVVWSETEKSLTRQVPGSRLTSFQVSSSPQWLSGAKPRKDDTSKAILVRTGVAFEFVLSVSHPDGRSFNLQGIFTWVGTHLDDPPNVKQRLWMDLNATLATHGEGGLLKERLYLLDTMKED